MAAVPTVLRTGNIRIAVFTRDEHEPPHVHVEHPNGTVVVLLDEKAGAARLKEASRNMRARDIRAIVEFVDEHFDKLLTAWETYNR
ncbi:MAG: hypothetical protein NVSMB64_07810 [Candidatus Velthaea sp.]